MLDDLVTRRRHLEHLAGLDDRRLGQEQSTGVAVTRWGMRFDPIGLRHALEGLPWMARLTARVAPIGSSPVRLLLVRHT